MNLTLLIVAVVIYAISCFCPLWAYRSTDLGFKTWLEGLDLVLTLVALAVLFAAFDNKLLFVLFTFVYLFFTSRYTVEAKKKGWNPYG